jgi:hypothetical protein
MQKLFSPEGKQELEARLAKTTPQDEEEGWKELFTLEEVVAEGIQRANAYVTSERQKKLNLDNQIKLLSQKMQDLTDAITLLDALVSTPYIRKSCYNKVVVNE